MVHNVKSSTKWTTSKNSADIPNANDCSKTPGKGQIMPSNHLAVPSINSNQEHLTEAIRDIKIKTHQTQQSYNYHYRRLHGKKVFGGKLSR